MAERSVGFGHLVRVFALFDGGTTVIARIEQVRQQDARALCFRCVHGRL